MHLHFARETMIASTKHRLMSAYNLKEIYDAMLGAMSYETPIREVASQYPPAVGTTDDSVVIWWFSLLCEVHYNVMAVSVQQYDDIVPRALELHTWNVRSIDHTPSQPEHDIARSIRQICYW